MKRYSTFGKGKQEVQIFAQANQNTGGSDAIKTRNKS